MGLVVVYLALFTAAAAALALLHSLVTGAEFRFSWRWIHDTTILPSNLALIPPIGLVILIQSRLGRNKHDFLVWMPRWVRRLVFLIIALFIANSVSQAAGGCVWFVFTEGWWVRFGHGWLLWDGSVLAEEVVIGFYLLFLVLAVASGLWFKRHYLDEPSLKKPGKSPIVVQ